MKWRAKEDVPVCSSWYRERGAAAPVPDGDVCLCLQNPRLPATKVQQCRQRRAQTMSVFCPEAKTAESGRGCNQRTQRGTASDGANDGVETADSEPSAMTQRDQAERRNQYGERGTNQTAPENGKMFAGEGSVPPQNHGETSSLYAQGETERGGVHGTCGPECGEPV